MEPVEVRAVVTDEVAVTDELAVRYVVTALVVVEFPTIRLVIELRVAIKDEKKPLVEVALDAMRLVVEAFVIVAFVVVELPMIALVKEANVARRDEKNPVVLVLLVEKRLVAVRAVAEAVFKVV